MTDPQYSPWGQPAPEPAKKPPERPDARQEDPQPYAPPPYGHPHHAYGPPPIGYGPAPAPPPYGYYPQPAVGPNAMAIASLVLAFFCAPAGLICGIVALNQLKERPQEGRGLAIAGIVISTLAILATIGFFALWVALWTSI